MEEIEHREDNLSHHEPNEDRKPPVPTLTDTDFAVSVDTLLWVSPSGEHRNNAENLNAVNWSLEELETCTQLLNDLLDHLITLTSWREHPQLAVLVLEALLFTETLAGRREPLNPSS